MGFMDERLWDIFEKKTAQEDNETRKELQIGSEYISAVKKICIYGRDRALTIRDTFPMYTLHNETHICNVMRLMADLLGDKLDKLTRDEAAMLIMSACCHDIGMSCSKEEKEALFGDIDRLNQYLENNHSEYVKAYSSGNKEPIMTDDMIQNYLRSIHHERVMELLFSLDWPSVLEGKVDRENLVRVCQSHGRDIASLDELDDTATVDLRFCAILLRLADILDFDTSRAPEAVYIYSGFQKTNDANVLKSKEEWDKHLVSQGFDFQHIKERIHMYPLEYRATCRSMQVEQTINCYLDWVDQELSNSGKELKRFAGRWQNFILPGKIKRSIKSEGYVSGQYRLSLDQDKILELFIGKDLYSDPSVFVRELIQNAIDAVRTRKQLDKNLPADWKGQINIRCWMDEEGYHWFRIEDNGIGMTEEVIKNYFLKIGSSYYSSDTFTKSKLQCNADADYMPISRFGIGILSCFMGDEQTNQVEISTKHFNEGHIYYPALRLRMHGINGYYYLSNKDKSHMPGPMKGVTEKEKAQYLVQAGTAIAVRTNLYQTAKYKGFKEIVDKYVIYPPVAVHYDGDEGSCDYLTEQEFTDALDSIYPSDNLEEKGVKEFAIPDEELNKLYRDVPEFSYNMPPKLVLKCISLKDYTSTSFLRGAVITIKIEGAYDTIILKLGNRHIAAKVLTRLNIDKQCDRVGIQITLKFDDDFERLMEILMKKYSPKNDMVYELNRKMRFMYPNDKLKNEVLTALIEANMNKNSWDEYFINRYKISEEILNETISEVTEFVKRNGFPNIIDDLSTLNAFYVLKRNWSFELCSLSKLEWYNKYFKSFINKTGICSIAAHNGVLCGDADYFFRGDIDINLATIILFKDKYRPHLDVSRDGVRGLTLEMASEIEIIRRNLLDQGFIIYKNSSVLREANYPYIVMTDYCKLLNERDDLAKQLIFRTSEGNLINENLIVKLINDDKIEYQSCPRVYNKEIFGYEEGVYEYLSAAFLREHYLVQADFTIDDGKIFISKKEKTLSEDYMKLFPACFFLPDLNKNSTILTTKSPNDRCACNEYHRLSQFIIKNGIKLNKHVPGIFRELLRILAEEEESELIDKVNNLLEYLKKFPRGIFQITDELLLSEADLV